MFKTLILALAAVASVSGIVIPKHKEFALAMTVNGQKVSLNAVGNGTANRMVLEAERLAAYPGTKAFLHTAPGKADVALDFVLEGVVYGAGVPIVGDNQGTAAPVFIQTNFQQYQWSANKKGVVSHTLQSPNDAFFACKDHVKGGAENYFLKFGVFQENGKPPKGCVATTVVQNFDVPGGATGPGSD